MRCKHSRFYLLKKKKKKKKVNRVSFEQEVLARVVPQNEKNDNGEKSEMSLGQRRGHVGVGLEWYG